MSDTQVLIIGAGPTGLVLALYLKKLGIRVRIIDQAAQAGTTSRALVVHARTLEFYRWLGIADEVVAAGTKAKGLHLWVAGKEAAHVPVGEMGAGLSPYPYLLFFPQDEHEGLLIEALAKLGVSVEREKEFLDFSEDAKGIVARIKSVVGKEESCRAEFIAGCDGARSRMRELLQTGFPGSTYSQLYYVADVEASGPAINGDLNVALDEADFLAVFPLRGRARLIGTIDSSVEAKGKKLEWNDVQHVAIDHLKVKVEKINWFSTYRVHHRVTEHYRKGRGFLLGDAAHIHSPVGGQGMNTGIGDAINLGWKLALVLRGQAKDSLLDTYEAERIAFARRLVQTTDRVFTFVNQNGFIARHVRLFLVPILIPLLFSMRDMRRFMFRTVSQIAIHYRMSKLSEGSAGALRGGDRLPWVKFADGSDNFAGLDGLHWSVQVYGEAREGVNEFCGKHGIKLESFLWEAGFQKLGLAKNVFYLIRPDGYVGFCGVGQLEE
ncbi:MAG: FAD-dependent monooxygenase, partial [Bdellovibrionota bacterium]